MSEKVLFIYKMLPFPDYPTYILMIPEEELPEGIWALDGHYCNLDPYEEKVDNLHKLVWDSIVKPDSEVHVENEAIQGQWHKYLVKKDGEGHFFNHGEDQDSSLLEGKFKILMSGFYG
ncbi:MAG: hypothetical protein CL489_10730 [Acidobacteria bacterium]|nr:hypothetical protein [Acidobacteriota bacterium]|tara:strand:+ start:557 stop:910 length:354 start_codon:yes stop_codon:yes gene_type:complete